jgi:hypothetical protein
VERSSGKTLLIEIDYVPLPSQNKFHVSTARFKGFSGPIGSGKSQALCQEAIRLSYLNPGRQGLIGAPTYTTSTFQTTYGRAMAVITSNTVDPTVIPQEAAFLPGLIGTFTAQIRAFVHATYPACRFEVLYPPDVNNFALTQVINYPTGDWTPANLNCLKTESFSFTYDRDLDLSLVSMNAVSSLGFTPSERSHLVGISDPSTAWLKEVRLAQGLGFESVVLFALDQMCLVGYSLPLSTGFRRSTRLG